jgi:hypothetical protein
LHTSDSFQKDQVLAEISEFLSRYPARPKVFISYDRTAYADRTDPDFRVSFDRNILTRRYNVDMSSGGCGSRLLTDGRILMEIKCIGRIPLWLCRILSEMKLYKTSFSKYGREYESQLINNRQLKGEIITCSKEYSTALVAQPQLAHQSL